MNEINKEQEDIIKKLAENPKIKRALKGLLAPLEQEGDKLIITTK